MATSIPAGHQSSVRPMLTRALSHANFPASPVTALGLSKDHLDAVLELADGSAYQGISFGVEGKSVSGECVFQTGGYFDSFVFAYLTCCRYGWVHPVLDGPII